MRAILLITALGIFACKSHPPAQPPPSGDELNCAEPRPNDAAVCVQDCGPPVVRDGDPPPAWRWLSPEEVTQRQEFGCPRCLPAGTEIATPSGPVAVEALTAGVVVWSLDAAGQRVAVPVVRTSAVPTPLDHTLVEIDLADGRTVVGSGGHPTAAGAPLAAIAVGQILDTAQVIAVRRVPYTGGHTYDLLPASPSGVYWADGVLIGSTLR